MLLPPVADCGTLPVASQSFETRSAVDVLSLPWQVAGVQHAGHSLALTPTDLAIASQGGYADNPPWNAQNRFGFTNSFRLAGTFDVGESITILAGQLPLVYDEFVFRRSSVALSMTASSLTATVWDGQSDHPSTQVLELTDHGPRKNLQLVLEAGQLQITVDGQHLTVPTALTSVSPLWLGLVGEGTVTSLEASSIGGLTVSDMATTSAVPCTVGLRTLVARYRPGFALGAAVAVAPWVSDPRYAALLADNFNAITIENALKPQFSEPRRGVFTLQEAIFLARLAIAADMSVHGHALVPDRSFPQWMAESNPQDRQAIMVGHIVGVVRGMGALVQSWDVVNEPLDPGYAGLPWQSGWRNTIWYQAMGDGYFDTAFQAARAANPHATLWVNDYAMDKDSLIDEVRFQFLFGELVKLKKQGYNVGLGFEGHVYELPRDRMSARALQQRFAQLAAAGIKARVSEMDVAPKDSQGTVTPDSLALQAQQFRNILAVCLTAPNCVGFTTWGVGGSYVSTAGIDGGGR